MSRNTPYKTTTLVGMLDLKAAKIGRSTGANIVDLPMVVAVPKACFSSVSGIVWWAQGKDAGQASSSEGLHGVSLACAILVDVGVGAGVGAGGENKWFRCLGPATSEDS